MEIEQIEWTSKANPYEFVNRLSITCRKHNIEHAPGPYQPQDVYSGVNKYTHTTWKSVGIQKGNQNGNQWAKKITRKTKRKSIGPKTQKELKRKSTRINNNLHGNGWESKII